MTLNVVEDATLPNTFCHMREDAAIEGDCGDLGLL
jgi:hypothetical protein